MAKRRVRIPAKTRQRKTETLVLYEGDKRFIVKEQSPSLNSPGGRACQIRFDILPQKQKEGKKPKQRHLQYIDGTETGCFILPNALSQRCKYPLKSEWE